MKSRSVTVHPINRVPKHNEGLRKQKRRETHQRIAQTGLKLFIANGYEDTTLEAIAEAAGISRRTFFYYFKSKDDILLAWQGSGFEEALGSAVVMESPDQAPLDAVRNCLLKLAVRYETKESIIVDRLFRSTDALRLRKQAIFVQMEQTLFAALCKLWPQPERRTSLRIAAMVSIGVMRLAMDAWRKDGGKRPLEKYLRESFIALEAEI
jgi:AcrR family transcriptional regulator